MPPRQFAGYVLVNTHPVVHAQRTTLGHAALVLGLDPDEVQMCLETHGRCDNGSWFLTYASYEDVPLSALPH